MKGWLVPGANVLSKTFGSAMVREVSRAGIQIEPSGLGILVRVMEADLSPLSSKAELPPAPRLQVDTRSPLPLVAAVDALRFGIVPIGHLDKVTVGYEEIHDWVTGRLPSNGIGGPTFSEVCAPYGLGKSHQMEAIRDIAFGAGYVVANVELDGVGATLCDPTRLLAQLLSSLRLPGVDSFHPALDLHVRALEMSGGSVLAGTRTFEKVRANVQTVATLKRLSLLDPFEEKLDALLSGISDYAPTYLRKEIVAEIDDADDRAGVTPMALVGRSVEERPVDFVNALLGYAAVSQRAGYNGLVVTLDEFETECVTLPAARMLRLGGMIRALASHLNDPELSRSAPLAIFVASVGRGGQDRDPFLKHVSSTPCGDNRELITWSAGAMNVLADKIHCLYREAYGTANSLSVRENRAGIAAAAKEGTAHVRRFLRNYIAFLDARYGPPANAS